MSEELGICPWMGKECPGPEKCAPANHHMQIMWRDTDQEIADPHPLCPIALTTEALHTWASSPAPTCSIFDLDSPPYWKKESPDNQDQ